MRTALLPVLAAALVAGCASMSEDQCRRANWVEQGQRDGRNGEPEGRIDAHRKACEKAGVVPDAAAWNRGWTEGVRSYCTPRVAWDRGSRGVAYEGACRRFDEETFLRWHRLGKDVYRTRGERDQNRREVEKLEKELGKAEKDDERKALREKIRQLDKEHARLRRLLETLEAGAPK